MMLLLAACLFPPWQTKQSNGLREQVRSIGYASIFFPPVAEVEHDVDAVSLDVHRLTLEVAAILLLTSALAVAFAGQAQASEASGRTVSWKAVVGGVVFVAGAGTVIAWLLNEEHQRRIDQESRSKASIAASEKRVEVATAIRDIRRQEQARIAAEQQELRAQMAAESAAIAEQTRLSSPKKWSVIKFDDAKAGLETSLRGNRLYYRLTFSGHPEAFETFSQRHSGLNLHFTDDSGFDLATDYLSTSAFQFVRGGSKASWVAQGALPMAPDTYDAIKKWSVVGG
jgi:hypothetical protein